MSAAITSDGIGHPKSLNPTPEQSGCAVRGGGGRQRNSFWPARGTVDNREQEGVARGDRQWPYQVNMEMCKTPSRDRNFLRLQVNVAADFGPLAGEAGASEQRDISAHLGPAEFRLHHAGGSAHPWVTDRVQRLANRCAECQRNEGPKNTGGNVPKEKNLAHPSVDNRN